jgi:hypothetical protein
VGEKIADDNIQFQPLGAMTFLRKDNNLNWKKFGLKEWHKIPNNHDTGCVFTTLHFLHDL